MKLDALKIIVTGAASGMGAHFARALHESGAKVAAGDVNEGLLEELPKGIARRKLDVSKEDDVASFVQWAHKELGGLNGLVNNAGILRDGLLVKQDRETKAIKRLSFDDWSAVLAVNLTGATMMLREVVSKMVETGTRPGVIV